MSAGGLSYSALNNYGVVTLPSVDSWGTNMNILRDPPKSITTRRIDKVGENSSITTMIDDSGNRACEAIQVYARGVNPMVSVSYSNVGNNGGQRSSGLTTGGQTHAFLPYRVMRDGAFRPPVRRQEDLLPLSRQPRAWTQAFTQKSFIDFSKKLRTCGTAFNTREVRDEIIHNNVKPTAVYKMETPIKENFTVKNVIQPTINVTASSGIRTMDRTQQEVKKPTKINRDMVYAFAQSNKVGNKYVNNNSVSTDRYMQDTNAHAVNSNVGAPHIQTTPIDELIDMKDVRTSEVLTTNYRTAVSGMEQNNYIHDDIELRRTLPEHIARTNIGNTRVNKSTSYENEIELERNTPLASMTINSGGRGETEISSRDYHLAPKISAGGFSVPASVPMTGRMQSVNEHYESAKAKMSRDVMKNMEGRFAY